MINNENQLKAAVDQIKDRLRGSCPEALRVQCIAPIGLVSIWSGGCWIDWLLSMMRWERQNEVAQLLVQVVYLPNESKICFWVAKEQKQVVEQVLRNYFSNRNLAVQEMSADWFQRLEARQKEIQRQAQEMYFRGELG